MKTERLMIKPPSYTGDSGWTVEGGWYKDNKYAVVAGNSVMTRRIVATAGDANDAHLMSAAPELANALRGLLAWLDTYRVIQGLHDDGGPLGKLVVNAKAAIAKADGMGGGR